MREATQPSNHLSRGSSSSSLACPEPPPSPATLTPPSCSSSSASSKGCGTSGGTGALPPPLLTRKTLLSPAAVTPLSRLEWQIAAAEAARPEGGQEAQPVAAASLPASAGSSPGSQLIEAATQCRRHQGQHQERQQQQQQQQEDDSDLYKPPVWMVVAFALSTLPGEQGTLLDVWCQMQLLLSGAALLPDPDQVARFLATCSFDSRGIQALKHTARGPEYHLHQERIPPVMQPGWLYFQRWAQLAQRQAAAARGWAGNEGQVAAVGPAAAAGGGTRQQPVLGGGAGWRRRGELESI